MAHTAKPYAAVPTLFDRVQDELSAIDQITRVLGSLPDHETRVRVIKWINDRFANGFQDPHAQPPPAVELASPPVERSSDSGLSFPDDLFDPAPGSSDAADLHAVFGPPGPKPRGLDLDGIFDPPAPKPRGLDLDGIFDPCPEQVFDPRPEPVVDFVPETPSAAAVEVVDDAFELVPPAEAPAAELADEAAAEPARPFDRRQLTLLLLADMTPPSAAAVEPPTSADEIGESPVAAAPVSPIVAAAATPPAQPAPPQPSEGEAAQDTMEALLRSLVDDFRQLADEWGNT